MENVPLLSDNTSSLGVFHFCLELCVCPLLLNDFHSPCLTLFSSLHSNTLFFPSLFPSTSHPNLLPFFSYRMRRQNNLYFTPLLFFISLSWGHRPNPGDERSSCDRCDLHLLCNCSYGGFTSVPMVTDRALILDLSFNNIAIMKNDDLAGHTLMRVLSLHGNADGSLLGFIEKYKIFLKSFDILL